MVPKPLVQQPKAQALATRHVVGDANGIGRDGHASSSVRTLHSADDRRPAQHITCDFAPAIDVTARRVVMKRQLEALGASYFFDSMSETMFPARPAILLLRDAAWDPAIARTWHRSAERIRNMDTLGIEPRASRMLSGCDTTTPCALGWGRRKAGARKHTRDGQIRDAPTPFQQEHLICHSRRDTTVNQNRRPQAAGNGARASGRGTCM